MAEEELGSNTFESYPYGVSLSCAVEDYLFAYSLTEELQELGLGVYYDEYLQPIKESASLYSHITDLYQNKAPYRIVLLSQHFISQTDLEQEISQTLILGKYANTIFIQLDDVDISGIPNSISCLDSKHRKNFQDLSKKIFQATSKVPPGHATRKEQPRGTAGLKTSGDWISIGKNHFKARRYREASAAFDEALKINPNSEEAKNWKRILLKERGY
jgi:tetratricopeptide (TPR) repeat protein